MHSEYITSHCIKNDSDRLLLMDYVKTDITEVSEILKIIVLDLIEQCCLHLGKFHDYNKKNNKKYYLFQDDILNKLEDILYVKRKFVEFFATPGKKTKADLYTYVFGINLSSRYFDEHLYFIIVNLIKGPHSNDFWEKHNLKKYELNSSKYNDYYVFFDNHYDVNTGVFEPDVNMISKRVDDYIKTLRGDNRCLRENIINTLSNIIDNYYNYEFAFANNPYRDSAGLLLKRVKLAEAKEKPKEFIKRI